MKHIIRSFLKEFGFATVASDEDAWRVWRMLDLQRTKEAVGLVLKNTLRTGDLDLYRQLFHLLEQVWDVTNDGTLYYLPREDIAHYDSVRQCYMYYSCLHDPEVDSAKRVRYLKKWSSLLGVHVTEENMKRILDERWLLK